jgi:UDP-N-acetylglucosamine 2-epimerase (non-hydrolysing)
MYSSRLINIACIVGARPNFIKIAPILTALKNHGGFVPRLIHTGQHYDVEMNAVFFNELGLPDPDVNLEVGSGSQTVQTAQIMTKLEEVFSAERPDMVLLVGDVNSTVAAALVAAKLLIPIAHVEAGLRSFDRRMPEEINRLVTDRLSEILLTTERVASEQLKQEGVAPEAIHFVGNVMIDTLIANLDKAIPIQATLSSYGIDLGIAASVAKRYAIVTLHRPSNVDDLSRLSGLLDVLEIFSKSIPLIFTLGLGGKISGSGIFIVPPLSYFQMLGATSEATLVVTDSGGLQEETTALGIPCLTVRENTERPITIEQGTNTLVGARPDELASALNIALLGGAKRGRIPELWDGRASERIVAVIEEYFQSKV